MNNTRLEAFSDGVIAIIITIMVLELKVPHGTTLEALAPLIPNFLSYVLSFIYVGIYWSNHHHMLHTCESVTGRILWANLHLLFWLSLIPATTAWMSENHRESAPSALYGADLLMAAIAYFILERLIIASEGQGSLLKRAVGRHGADAALAADLHARLDDSAEVPQAWRDMDITMVAAPLGDPHTAVVLGRPGPEFRPSEVARLGYLAGIVATMLR